MSWHLGVFQALVQSAIAGTILTGVATVAIAFVKQPARQIRLIEFTLFGLCILPLASLVPWLPRWSVLPALVELDASQRAPEQIELFPVEPLNDLASTAAQAPTREWTQPLVGPGVQETIASPTEAALSQPADTAPAIEPSQSEKTEPITTTATVTSSPALPIRSVPTAPVGGWDFRAWLVAAYLAGVAAMISWSAVGWLAVARLLRSARPADDRCQDILREIAGPSGQRVALVVSPRARQPCALAWRPTTIVLPSELCANPDSQSLRWALAHEWSHVERGDVWTWAASGLVRWFYSYQPLLWWLRRQLRLCQDFVADDRAAGTGRAHEDYAEFLTSYLVQADRRQLDAGLGIGGHASEMERRIVILVENHPPLESSSPRRWNLLVLPFAVLLIAAVAMFGERPRTVGAEPQIEPVTAPAPKATPAPATAKPRPTSPARVPPLESPKPAPSPTATPQAFGTVPVAGAAAPRKPRTIAPGDVLTIEIITNYLDELLLPPKTTAMVEDDGTVLLGSKYGSPHLAGKGLGDAAKLLEETISELIEKRAGQELKDQFTLRPLVMNVRVAYANQTNPAALLPTGSGTTYAPPLPGTPSTGPAPGAISPTKGYPQLIVGPLDDAVTPPFADPSTAKKHIEKSAPYTTQQPPGETRTRPPGLVPLLQPLDTVEVLLSLNSDRVVGGAYMGGDGDPRLRVSGTYPIEPDGNISLPHGYGRVNVKGLDEKQAGAALRKHLSGRIPILTALPTVRVVRRGRAVWPEGKEPAADYRVRAGDKLLISTAWAPSFEHMVNSEGKLAWSLGPENAETSVAGLTLAEAQGALQKVAFRDVPTGGGMGFATNQTTKKELVPILVTIGGWREEADPEVVEQFELSDAGRVQRLENDIRELKDMVRKLKGARN